MTCTTTTTATTGDGSQTTPFILKKGRKFALLVKVLTDTGAAFDLTGYTGRAQMRKFANDTGIPTATFTVTNRNQSTERGKADVELGAQASETGASPEIAAGDYVADVEFENDVDADDVVASNVFYIRVTAEVTK